MVFVLITWQNKLYLCRYLNYFPIFSFISVYYTEHKLHNRKRGRAGNQATADTWLYQNDFMGTKHFHKLNFRNKLLREGVQPNQHNLELFRNMILLTYMTVCSIPSLQAP